jgi:hypothetical protein
MLLIYLILQNAKKLSKMSKIVITASIPFEGQGSKVYPDSSGILAQP